MMFCSLQSCSQIGFETWIHTRTMLGNMLKYQFLCLVFRDSDKLVQRRANWHLHIERKPPSKMTPMQIQGWKPLASMISPNIWNALLATPHDGSRNRLRVEVGSIYYHTTQANMGSWFLYSPKMGSPAAN